MDETVLAVCKQFTTDPVIAISKLGNGLINDTFLITTQHTAFVLQSINRQVFPDPDRIMENLNLLSRHISRKQDQGSGLIIPKVLKTLTQQSYFIDAEQQFWRAMEYVENSISKEQITQALEAEQVGSSLGLFHVLLSDIKTDTFHDTLPGFHITPSYYATYQNLQKLTLDNSHSHTFKRCKEFIANFEGKINCLEDAKKKGLLHDRIIHGDPKLNNFLFHKQSNKIISLIDLDTVKPGLLHYDIADCLRSCCHIKQSNNFDLELCRLILKRYLQQVAVFFSASDYAYLYPAIELIPFELGLRFFNDYLQGNRYFKVNSPHQNLDRAWAQFQLSSSISQQKAEIRQIIRENR